MAINVAELISKIKKQAEKNEKAKKLELKSFVNDVVKRINHINNDFKDDAIALVHVYKALEKIGIDTAGFLKSEHYCTADGKYRSFDAVNSAHTLGFRKYGKNKNNVCLMVLGGGWCGNNGVCFLRDKNNELEITNDCGEFQGETALELFSRLNEKTEHSVDLASRIETFEEQFIEFRDAYMAYAKSLLD